MVKFVSGKTKKEFHFNNYEIGIKSGNPYFSKWKYAGVEKRFGVEVTEFKKNPIELQITFRFRGSQEDIKVNKNLFFEECERDLLNKTPGDFVVGEWVLSGYFLERETTPTNEFYGEEINTIFFAPYPFWFKQLERQFLPQSRSEGQEGLDFPTDFEFDFAEDQLGHETLMVDHYAPNHFRMIVYGPCVNPTVYINEYPYQINTILMENEYLIIDSRKHEVMKYHVNGMVEDIYNSREFAHSVFEMIPSGKLNINWSGAFGFDLILFLERSEPKW